MSNFDKMTRNPSTGKLQKASWIDNYFGNHIYGVQFPDGKIWNEKDIKDIEGDVEEITIIEHDGFHCGVCGKWVARKKKVSQFAVQWWDIWGLCDRCDNCRGGDLK